jgi:predicted metal-dependent phosphoesterase TrpH
MPAGQPFTRLCQQLAQLRSEAQRADLHLHTCHSDGDWTPEEVVNRAGARGLGAIAITDHDTCSAIPAARAAASRSGLALEVIAGVEVTCAYRGQELHLLGYFLDPDEPALAAALAGLRQQRRDRFLEMSSRLVRVDLAVDQSELQAQLDSDQALGRRNLATMLVRAGKAATVGEAFAHYLHDGGPVDVPKQGLPVASALALVHAAGGVCSWAHPPQDIDMEQVNELRGLGLDALEAVYPTFTSARSRRLRDLAREAGLAITGGSDCHGPLPVSRAIGSWGLRRAELEALRLRRTLVRNSR